jgi:hypothetical protein
MQYRNEPTYQEIHMEKIQVLRRAVYCQLNLSADDWGLYDLEGRDGVAKTINDMIQVCLETGNVRGCFRALSSYAEFGAADTEGYDTLYTIMHNVGLGDLV